MTVRPAAGRMFAGWITFSAGRAGEDTIIRAHLLMRANDPLYELGMTSGGRGKEDQFWAASMTALGTGLGVPDPQAETWSTCAGNHRQRRHARNIRHNAMLRSALQTVATPMTALRRWSRPAAR
jgi:hypothetical protein